MNHVKSRNLKIYVPLISIIIYFQTVKGVSGQKMF